MVLACIVVVRNSENRGRGMEVGGGCAVWLVVCTSFNRAPAAPVERCLSEPARSTR